jgi:valyl-tRNA synthetase
MTSSPMQLVILIFNRVYVQTPSRNDLILAQSGIITNLIKGCNLLNVLESNAPAPSGCSVFALGETKVFLLVRGMVDIEKEIEKCEIKKEKLTKLIEPIVQKQSNESYLLNVKQEVKDLDNNRLKGLQAEIDALQAAIKNFLSLK